MIRKVALVQALREAFPEDYAGLYSPEEMGNAAAVVIDDNSAIVPDEPQKKTEPKKAEEAPSEESPADILFK